MIDLTDVRTQLLTQAYLFEDPRAYEAGVDDTLDEIARVLGEQHHTTIDLTGARPKLRVTAG